MSATVQFVRLQLQQADVIVNITRDDDSQSVNVQGPQIALGESLDGDPRLGPNLWNCST